MTAASDLMLLSAAQAEIDAQSEREITAAGGEMLAAPTAELRKLAWTKMCALIFQRNPAQVKRMEQDLRLADAA